MHESQPQRNYDARDLAEELGLAPATVRSWVNQFGVRHTRKGVSMVLDEDGRRALQRIRELKSQGAGMNTIRITIAPAAAQPQREQDERNATEEQPQPVQCNHAATDIRDQVRQALQEHDGLAEKYARAAHEIGKLEAEKKALADALDQQRRLLAESTQERQAQAQQLQQAQDRIRELEAKLSRPWWRFWG